MKQNKDNGISENVAVFLEPCAATRTVARLLRRRDKAIHGRKKEITSITGAAYPVFGVCMWWFLVACRCGLAVAISFFL